MSVYDRIEVISDRLRRNASDLASIKFMGKGDNPEKKYNMLVQSIDVISQLREKLKHEENYLVEELVHLGSHEMGPDQEGSQADEAGQGKV